MKPAGTHHTHPSYENNTCTTAFHRPRLAERDKQTGSVLHSEADRGAKRGCSEKSQLPATPLRFKGADGICIDQVNEKKGIRGGGRYSVEGTRGGCRERKNLQLNVKYGDISSVFTLMQSALSLLGSDCLIGWILRSPNSPPNPPPPRISLTVEQRGKNRTRLTDASEHFRRALKTH